MTNIAIETGGFSIAMLVYQRVFIKMPPMTIKDAASQHPIGELSGSLRLVSSQREEWDAMATSHWEIGPSHCT